jgi:hypothetical protein
MQAWVDHSHNVTPITLPTLELSCVLFYIQRVTMTRQDRNTQHKHTTNPTTMVDGGGAAVNYNYVIRLCLC